jgi:hypothetical protein
MKTYSFKSFVFCLAYTIIATSNAQNLEVTGLLKVKGGNPGVGKVLTSDATGQATWNTANPAPLPAKTILMSEISGDVNFLNNGFSENGSTILKKYKSQSIAMIPETWINTAPDFIKATVEPRILAINGNQFVVFGGYDENGTQSRGGIYDAINDTWKVIPDMGESFTRSVPAIAWANGKLIVWGGRTDSGTYPSTGKIYDPSTLLWTNMGNLNAPVGRYISAHGFDPISSKFVVWGGDGAASSLNSGGLYDINTNTWQTMGATNAPSGRSRMGFGLNQGKLFINSGYISSGTFASDTYLFDCGTNVWMSASSSGLSTRYNTKVEYNGSSYVVWGGSNNTTETNGKIYTPGTNTWSTMSTIGAPGPYAYRNSTFSNGYFILTDAVGAYKFNINTNSWSVMPQINNRIINGMAGNSSCIFIFGGLKSSDIGSPVVEIGKRFFWTAQSIYQKTPVQEEIFLYKKN